jgi:hypothetical protein
MLYCPEDRQAAVTEALAALGLQRWPLTLDDQGVQVMGALPGARQHVPNRVPLVMEGTRIVAR